MLKACTNELGMTVLCTSSPLKSDDEFLNGLQEGLRSLQLVDDALHVRLVQRVAVEKGGPLEMISFSQVHDSTHSRAACPFLPDRVRF